MMITALLLQIFGCGCGIFTIIRAHKQSVQNVAPLIYYHHATNFQDSSSTTGKLNNMNLKEHSLMSSADAAGAHAHAV